MNWKEQFEKDLARFQKGDDAVIFTKNFIKTEIIEKLIDEIPDNEIWMYTADQKKRLEFKQQLRDKWL